MVDLEKVQATFDDSNIVMAIEDMLYPSDAYDLEDLTVPELRVLRGMIIEHVNLEFEHLIESMRSKK